MTREEAIQALKDISWQMGSVKRWENIEAIDMAIEALSDDTVSRETYHNLVTASNDIDRALREYQDKEENDELVSVVRCKDCIYNVTTTDGEYNPGYSVRLLGNGRA